MQYIAMNSAFIVVFLGKIVETRSLQYFPLPVALLVVSMKVLSPHKTNGGDKACIAWK